MLLLILHVSTIILELLFYQRSLWPYHRLLIALLTPVVTGLMVATALNGISITDLVIILLCVLRLTNYLRIAENRIHDSYLYRTTIRTSYIACSLLISVIGLELMGAFSAINLAHVIYGILCLQVVAVSVMSISFIRAIRKTRYNHDSSYISDRDLPTVTVAIPARNETQDLQACLDSVVTSNYPKLEILVLDDCSHTKPSEIIKAYARSGVRFIKGSQPKHGWLAKNQAYDTLALEAIGEIILFCGVDVRFGTNTIRALVTTMTVRNKDMISVLPKRRQGSLLAAFTQPTRYWWEIALPRRYIGRPAVLSTTWMVRKTQLLKAGGFKSVKRMVIPEGFFARTFSAARDAYSFMRASNDLDLEITKSPSEQWATAVRVRYPQLNKRPENVLLVIVMQLLIFILPYSFLLLGAILDLTLLLYVSIVIVCCLHAMHTALTHITNPANTWLALWNLPFCILFDTTVTIVSMIRYEFGTVSWKDRNICIPVMHNKQSTQVFNNHA